MMCCGQVPPLGCATVFANRLTHTDDGTRTIRYGLSALFTGCGAMFSAVDSLCPNPEWNRQSVGANAVRLFVP
jgi:hypothetical protein